mgnify:FL=1
MNNNFEENKKNALYVVNFVSAMYHLGDGVLVEFHPASRFPNPEVTAMVTSDYRILYNIDRLKVAPDYELYITSFHEMRHIYQHCCVDFRNKVRFSKYFKEPRERVLQWKKEFANYYVSEVEDDLKYLGQDCEIDAIAFSYLMMKKLYEADMSIPNVIQDKVLERAKEIAKKMNLEL